MPLAKALVLLLSTAALLPAAQDGVISTYVGAAIVDGVPAAQTALGSPEGMAIDAVGNIYFADSSSNRIRRIDGSTGIISTVAGTGVAGFNGDFRPAASAQLNRPNAVALVANSGFGGSAVLYISDAQNHRVRRVDLGTGTIDTVAGNGNPNYSGDAGPAILAGVERPGGVAASGSYVYITDPSNHRIRRVSLSDGNITTVAGTGSFGFSGDAGPGAAANLAGPQGCYYANNYLYFADRSNHRIRRLDSGNNITTVAGTGTSGLSGNFGPAMSAQLSSPNGVFVNAAGDLYIADTNNAVIRRVLAGTQIITTAAGSGVGGYSGDFGLPTLAKLDDPKHMVADAAGALYIADGNHCLRKVSTSGLQITTFAGNGQQNGVPATLVQLDEPIALGFASGGDLILSDATNNRVRRVDPATQLVSTFAGAGLTYTAGDGGPALSSGVRGPIGLATGANGTTYIVESSASTIRAVNSAGNITRIAGTTSGYSGDNGPAISAQMRPFGLCVVGSNLYVAEAFQHVIRRIDLNTMTIHYVAGLGGSGNDGYVNGLSATARFNFPYNIAADAAGNLYVADGRNNAIRRISNTNPAVVSTICGLGPTQGGYSGDGGLAASAALNFPVGVHFDPLGDLWISDSSNHRIRRITMATGMIETMAGNGLQGLSGDGGPSRSATLNFPVGVQFDAVGDLYICDYQNAVVRKVSYQQSPTPTPVSSGGDKVVAYPSPADQRVCISYQLAKPGTVSIEVYNVALQLAAVLKEADLMLPGFQKTCADISALANGPYFFRVKVGGELLGTGKFKVLR